MRCLHVNCFFFCASISVSRHQYRSNWSSYTPSHLDSTLVSNMHKLFSERIEIFSTVEFNRVSILTGIIKISLKVKYTKTFFFWGVFKIFIHYLLQTFMECVRLKTFSKYGLQQIQVDTHYLQLYLWRFVADEKYKRFFFHCCVINWFILQFGAFSIGRDFRFSCSQMFGASFNGT